MKERKGVEHEYKSINTKELNVDYLYQRDIDLKRVKRIAKNYDPCLVNPIKVSLRDGKYYIFDGQHTVSAEKMVRGKGKDVVVECKVFTGLSRADEMELFVAQNGESSGVKINDRMKALFNFGDRDVVNMVNAASEAGVRVDFSSGTAMNKVTALSALTKVYMRRTNNEFIEILTVLRQSWDGISESFTRELLLGMDKFYEHYYGKFKKQDLVSSLSKVTPNAIIREGKSLNSSVTSNITYARLILRTYNTNRRNKLEDVL